jgi:hypothetical protein
MGLDVVNATAREGSSGTVYIVQGNGGALVCDRMGFGVIF